MLITLGFSMIAVFMYLILTKRLTPMVALILVPLTFAALAGAFGVTGQADEGVVDSIMTAVGDFAPTAVLLFFAIIYFGLMIDVGLFDPLIRFVLRVVGNDPVRLVVCTAVLAGVVSLDGDGSTTFIITVSALLPIYLRLGMSPVVLTVVANLANGVLNIVPWGGPTVRAATVLKVSPSELFNPMVPGMIAGLATVIVLAYFLGRSERARLARSGRTLAQVAATLQPAAVGAGSRPTGGGGVTVLDDDRDRPRRRRRHGQRPGPEPPDPAPEADLVQPRAHRRPADPARAGPAAAVAGVRRRPPRSRWWSTSRSRTTRSPRSRRTPRRSSRWWPWSSRPPCWSGCCPAPGWSPRWPTASWPRCPSRSAPGSP